jgi:hypothetical protein
MKTQERHAPFAGNQLRLRVGFVLTICVKYHERGVFARSASKIHSAAVKEVEELEYSIGRRPGVYYRSVELSKRSSM